MADDFISSLAQGLRGAAGVLNPAIQAQNAQQDFYAQQMREARREKRIAEITAAIRDGSLDAIKGNQMLRDLGESLDIGMSQQARSASALEEDRKQLLSEKQASASNAVNLGDASSALIGMIGQKRNGTGPTVTREDIAPWLQQAESQLGTDADRKQAIKDAIEGPKIKQVKVSLENGNIGLLDESTGKVKDTGVKERQPVGVTVQNFGAPVQGIDPATGQPTFFQPSNRGGLTNTGVKPLPKPGSQKAADDQKRGAEMLSQLDRAEKDVIRTTNEGTAVTGVGGLANRVIEGVGGQISPNMPQPAHESSRRIELLRAQLAGALQRSGRASKENLARLETILPSTGIGVTPQNQLDAIRDAKQFIASIYGLEATMNDSPLPGLATPLPGSVTKSKYSTMSTEELKKAAGVQ